MIRSFFQDVSTSVVINALFGCMRLPGADGEHWKMSMTQLNHAVRHLVANRNAVSKSIGLLIATETTVLKKQSCGGELSLVCSLRRPGAR